MTLKINTKDAIAKLTALATKRAVEEKAAKEQKARDREYNLGVLTKNLRSVSAADVLKVMYDRSDLYKLLNKGFREEATKPYSGRRTFDSCELKHMVARLKLETRPTINLQPDDTIILALTGDIDCKI